MKLNKYKHVFEKGRQLMAKVLIDPAFKEKHIRNSVDNHAELIAVHQNRNGHRRSGDVGFVPENTIFVYNGGENALEEYLKNATWEIHPKRASQKYVVIESNVNCVTTQASKNKAGPVVYSVAAVNKFLYVVAWAEGKGVHWQYSVCHVGRTLN